MNIERRPISSLLDYSFIIPAYQRGYRWDREQVESMLDDFMEFCHNSEGKSTFYCLQPVVVVPETSAPDCRRFEVVDGQQRLTTLYLILSYFRSKEDYPTETYRLEMPSRDSQEKYIGEDGFRTAENGEDSNIDNFYLRKAYEIIHGRLQKDPDFRAKLHSFLTRRQPQKGFRPHIAIIWYCIDGVDAYMTFKRLNDGKIPLTCAELVKALLLQTDCYGEIYAAKAEELATSRSHEWNRMEQSLREDSFRGMLGMESTEDSSLMDVVIDLVADEYQQEKKYELERKPAGAAVADYFNFKVIGAVLSEPSDEENFEDAAKDRLDAAKAVWNRIQEKFTQLRNWHDNRRLYHLIGLYSLVRKKSGTSLLSEIWQIQQEAADKTDFGRLLRRRIGRDLKVREYVNGENNERPADRQGLDSPDLAYEQAESAKLISILEAHNVWTVERNMDKSTRFPFLLFRKNKSTSLEHIHPQNITDSNAFDDYNDWFRNRRSEIPKALALYQQRKGVDRKPDMELKVLESERQLEILLSDIAKLKTGHARAFEDKAEEIRAHVLVIDSLFGDMASISPRELHHIKNLALVDGPTNSALQNYFLDDKRKILISRMEQGYYIPEATRNVFSKYYSAGNVKDMNFWSPADREAYLDDIREVYDFFTASV